MTDYYPTIIKGNCFDWFKDTKDKKIHLTFFDPPYNQGKTYRYFNDNLPERTYWMRMKRVLKNVYEITESGGAIYFMQREKNAEKLLKILRETGWKFRNLIIWKKRTSAVPLSKGFSKQYQIIAFAVKGEKPHIFNKLRIDYPLLPHHKYPRKNGIYITDVWDDIKELTSGFFAGNEAIREKNGDRSHTQQSPIALLLRIILSSTNVGDTILDPMAGTGTTSVVAYQLKRNSISIEIDPDNVAIIEKRLDPIRPSDNILHYYDYYRYTEKLEKIWPREHAQTKLNP